MAGILAIRCIKSTLTATALLHHRPTGALVFVARLETRLKAFRRHSFLYLIRSFYSIQRGEATFRALRAFHAEAQARCESQGKASSLT